MCVIISVLFLFERGSDERARSRCVSNQGTLEIPQERSGNNWCDAVLGWMGDWQERF